MTAVAALASISGSVTFSWTHVARKRFCSTLGRAQVSASADGIHTCGCHGVWVVPGAAHPAVAIEPRPPTWSGLLFGLIWELPRARTKLSLLV